jgi:hypothetical protein
VYRVYVADRGLDRTGGVGVPRVTLLAPNGSTRTLQPCPFADAESSLPNLIVLLRLNGFTDAANFLQGILAATNRLTAGSCNLSQPTPAAVTFAPATLGADFFPNIETTYLETSGLCFQAGKVLVVRGKAPVFPNTYVGESIFESAFDGEIQLRYWSMCNNDRVIPYPVVACRADFETELDNDYYYTYVVSGDPSPPTGLPPHATWLPWGATAVPKNLILRNILPTDFTGGGDYYPRGVFCDQMLFLQQGWQGCFAAAGLTLAGASRLAGVIH